MSHQPAFRFELPIATSLDPVARHCSIEGAVDAQECVGRQCLALLTIYRERGPLTDSEAADALQIERSTINARRYELIKRGLVVQIAVKKNPQTGISNTTWGLR